MNISFYRVAGLLACLGSAAVTLAGIIFVIG